MKKLIILAIILFLATIAYARYDKMADMYRMMGVEPPLEYVQHGDYMDASKDSGWWRTHN